MKREVPGYEGESMFLNGKSGPGNQHGDTGSAARFFYCAKASKKERTVNGEVENGHPTVKPVALMRWLVRLITPPGGTVLDPYCGSGTTGIACKEEGFNFVGIDLHHAELARDRIAAWETEAEEKDNQLTIFAAQKETA